MRSNLVDKLASCEIPLPILVTGITGVAGYNAFLSLRQQFPGSVIGLRAPKTYRLLGEGIVPGDAADASMLEKLFRRHQFRSVLNATGNCALKSCELNPAMAAELNVASAAIIAPLCQRYDSRLVHLSSDLVFSGNGAGGYVETDPTDPVTVYGKTMEEGEQIISAMMPTSAILRISLPMGPSFNRHAGAIDWIESRFRAHRPATLYFDEVRSCTYVDDLNVVFRYFLSNRESGLFHAGGPVHRTLYQIAQIVNRVGDYQAELVHGCMRIEAGPMPPRAGNCSMNSDKLLSLLARDGLGAVLKPWPKEPELIPTTHRWHRDRPNDEWRGRDALEQRLYRPNDGAGHPPKLLAK